MDSITRWNDDAIPEEANVAWDCLFPVKAGLLWRIGKTELAEKVWTQWTSVKLQVSDKDPYLSLATDWAWSLFDRAICALIRGDDHLALASARAASPITLPFGSNPSRRTEPSV